jgi:WD40 repeat protein
MNPPRPAVATFYSYKGGVGRTMLAVNTAVALARERKTLLWDLDVEAPGMHHIAGLGLSTAPTKGFLDWLCAWQPRGKRALDPVLSPPTAKQLAQLSKAVRPTKFNNLNILPAHGGSSDPAYLYTQIDWPRWFVHELPVGMQLFEAVLAHLRAEGFEQVLIDARTGITDLGGLLVGLLPDITVLVGNYGQQNLVGMHQVWQALQARPQQQDALAGLRQGRPMPHRLLVLSPIPQDQPALLAAGQKLWQDRFGAHLEPIAIPFETSLPFTEELLILKPDLLVAQRYEAVAGALGQHFVGVLADHQAAVSAMAERADLSPSKTPGAEEADRAAQSRQGTQKGAAFEERVADLLRLLRFKVQAEQTFDSNRFDLVARLKAGLDEITYLVECKDLDQPVGKDALEKLLGWNQQPQAKALNARLMLVSRKGFSPQALHYARDHAIRAITPDDLERELIDTAPYLDNTIRSFEQSPLFTAYVSQRASLGGVRDGEETSDLLAHAQTWARGQGKRLWVLLGDYGTGKSAFVAKLSYHLALAARQDPQQPIPLAVNLRDVPNKASLEDVLATQWERRTQSRVDPALLLHLLRRGRLLLLLDSFDEMGIATAGRSVIEQFRSLARPAAEEPDSALGNRVLVTCREQFFREHGEATRTTNGSGDDRIGPLVGVALGLDAQLDRLLPFTAAQVKQFLQRRLGDLHAHQALNFMQKHGLIELGDRPQLLEVIINSLPKLREQGGQFSPGALYQAYTSIWLEDFKPTERQSSSEQLRGVLEVLAAELWGRTGNRLHYADLFALLRAQPALLAGLDPNQLDVELRTAAFLSRTPDGQYGFSHRSFLEFFLARRVEWATHQTSPTAAMAEVLAIPRLTVEVCDFVGELTPSDKPGRERLAVALQATLGGDDSLPAARINALILGRHLAVQDSAGTPLPTAVQAACARYLPAHARLAGCDLSGLFLGRTNLPNADLRNSDMRGTVWSAAWLQGTQMKGAQLLGAELDHANLRAANLDGVSAVRAVFSGADLRDASLVAADLTSALLERALVEAAHFDEACLRNARFTHAVGKPMVQGALLDGATARWAHPAFGDAVGKPALDRLRPALAPAEHNDAVTSVAFSADGSRIASGSRDNTVRVWDATSGAWLLTLEGHEGGVTSVAFSANSDRIGSGSRDNTVRLWDATSGAPLLTLQGHEGMVTTVAFSADGSRICSGGGHNTVRLWDATSGALLLALHGSEGGVNSVAVSADGRRICSGGGHNTVRLWDATSGALLLTLQGHEGAVYSVAFSANGSRICSGSGDNTVRLWDAASGVSLLTLQGHKGGVTSVAFSADGSRICSGSDDRTVRLWDAASGALLLTLQGHEGGVESVAFSAYGKHICSGGYDNTVRLWDAASGAPLFRLQGHEGGVKSVAFSAYGSRICSGGYDTTVRLWDATSGALLLTLQGHERWVSSVALSPDGSRICSGSGDNTVRLWDATSGALLLTLQGHGAWVSSVALSADGSRICSGSRDHTVRLWDATTGALLLTLAGHEDGATSVAFSADGSRICVGVDNWNVHLWDAKTGARLLVLQGHTGGVTSVGFSADGSRICSGSGDNTVRLWDATSGALLLTLQGHERSVNSVAFNADGSRICSGSLDRTVRLWDATSGVQLLTLQGHEACVTSVAFSADGSRICSGSLDHTLRLWDAATGALLQAMLPGAQGWACLDFYQDPRGLWRGHGEALNELIYTDPTETPKPHPWMPRRWRAAELPELRAPD